MEVRINSIMRQTGVYQSGDSKGKEYAMYLLFLGKGGITFGGQSDPILLPIFNDPASKEIFEFLEEIDRTEDEADSNREYVDMEALKATLKAAAEAALDEDEKTYYLNFLNMGTKLYDRRTFEPMHGCITFKSALLPIGEPGTKWILQNKNGEDVTRKGVKVIDTEATVYWREQWDCTRIDPETKKRGVWVPLKGGTSEEAARIAMSELRERQYVPVQESTDTAATLAAIFGAPATEQPATEAPAAEQPEPAATETPEPAAS